VTIQGCLNACKGTLIGVLCEEMRDYVAVYYPEFALATALVILQGVTQRAFLPPGGHLVGYHVLVGPPGCGKNDYLSFASMYLRATDEKLVAREPRSGEAIKATLAEFPSRVLIADEVGAVIAEGSNPKSRDPVAKSICNLWLELWSPRDVLAGSMAKDATKRVDDVHHPRWSMLGAMTGSDLDRICSIPEFAAKGLFSRVCMWPVREAIQPGYNPAKGSAKPSLATLEKLKALERRGRVGLAVDEDGSARSWKAAPTEALTWSPDGGWLDPLAQFRTRWDAMGARALNDAEHLDVVSGIVGRAKSKALTFACLHALASGREALSLPDVNWGYGLAWDLLEADLARLHIQTEEERTREEVMAILRAYPGCVMYVGDLKNARRHLKKMERRALDDILRSMEKDGLLAMSAGPRRGTCMVGLPPEREIGDADDPPPGRGYDSVTQAH